MTTCTTCGATWTGHRMEHCWACHETFTGTRAGDMHRVGSYSPNERRCLSAKEMRQRGLVPRTKPNGLVVWSRGGHNPHADH